MKHALCALLPLVSLAFACSPPSDPIGRGGAHFEVDQPLAADLRAQNFTCAVPGIGGIGNPKPESDTASPGPPDLPTAGSDVQPTNMGSKVYDGQKAGISGTYKVDCRIKGSSTYTIDLDMAGPNTSEFAPRTSGEVSVRMNGSVNASTGIGTGKVYVRTTETNAVSPNRSCSLQVLTDPSDASKYRVRPGAIDMTFICQDNTPSTSELSRCETRGTITLSHCKDD